MSKDNHSWFVYCSQCGVVEPIDGKGAASKKLTDHELAIGHKAAQDSFFVLASTRLDDFASSKKLLVGQLKV